MTSRWRVALFNLRGSAAQRAIPDDRLISQAYTASPPRAALSGGQLRIDPSEAFGELYAKFGIDAQQLGVDGKETEEFIVGLGAAPDLEQQGYRLWHLPVPTQYERQLTPIERTNPCPERSRRMPTCPCFVASEGTCDYKPHLQGKLPISAYRRFH